jgi:type II secretory pathway pseudopilin PulG
MRKAIPTRGLRRGEKGYALLVVMFLLALLAVTVTAVAPNVITNARREQEDEMIWRGKQYVRGIRLYYTKLHKFPTALDDLYKPKTGIRFMRQAYKDPMNTADGSWRMIYVGPNGALIGSLKNRTVNMNGQAAAGFGGAMPGPGATNSATGSSGMFGSANGFGSASSFGSSNSSFGSSSGFGSSSSFGSNSSTVGTSGLPAPSGSSTTQAPMTDAEADAALQAQAASIGDGTIIGGNIIGVGSKINKRSVEWYDKAKNYLQFEFIWDPSVDALTGARVGIPSNNPNTFGVFGNSSTPVGAPTTPNPTQNPTQNPNPNPPQNPGSPDPPLQAPPNQ